jgi:uncharacterized membrane protein YphA (DoxX/SURF4 family)
MLWTRIASRRLIPISGDDSPDHRFRQTDHLQGHSSERPHRANRETEEAVLRERPDLMVTITGILEILGAIGLLIPAVAPYAALCLSLLLVALFPANVRAAARGLTIGGRRATALPVRAVIQLVFLTATLSIAMR